MSVVSVKKEIEQNGWIALPDSGAAELIALTDKLGGGTTVKWLRARENGDVPAGRSLSSRHGRNDFPPHTDGAGRPLPARFVALLSERSYQAATLLFDGDDAALRGPEFSRSWLVSDGSRRFYAVPRRCIRGRVRWRLNPDIMSPAGGDRGLAIAMEPFGRMKNERIEWEPGMAIIWDNHRMLHAREAVGPEDGERSLLRVLVNE
jgi:hypothetical protein